MKFVLTTNLSRVTHAWFAVYAIAFLYLPVASLCQNAVANATRLGSSKSLAAPGAVVESIAKNTEAEKAGLQEGDVLLGWTQGDQHGTFESLFDVAWTEMRQKPLGTVGLIGTRKDKEQTWILGPGGWSIRLRPNFAEPLLVLYDREYEFVKNDKNVEAAQMWLTASSQLSRDQPAWLRAWLLERAAATFEVARQPQEADNAFQAAATLESASPALRAQILSDWAESLAGRNNWPEAATKLAQAASVRQQAMGDDLPTAVLLQKLGRAYKFTSKLTQAEQAFQQALAIRLKLAPQGLDMAGVLGDLGSLATYRTDLEKAEDYYLKVLAIRQKLVPGTLDVAAILNALGFLYVRRNEMKKGEDCYQQALTILERIDPDGLDIAWTFNSLGLLQLDYGDLEKAEVAIRKSLAIREKLAPGSLPMAGNFKSLAMVAFQRGDLAKAEELERKAFTIVQKAGPDSLSTSEGLYNLGAVVLHRGNLAGAERYFRQALIIQQKLAPGSFTYGHIVAGLGFVAQENGRLDEAEADLREALATSEKIAPDGIETGKALRNLGDLMQLRGDLIQAENCLQRSLAMEQKIAPNSLDVTWPLMGLGKIAETRGDAAKAEEYYRQALVVREKLAPAATEHADTLAAIAGILRKQQPGAAAEFYEKALHVLESQTARLGGSAEERAGFRAKHGNLYRDYVELLISQNQIAHAFDVLEHSRAQTLMETLANAHIDVRKGVAPELLDRERSLRAAINVKSERRLRLLGGKHSEEQIKVVDGEVSDLLAQYQDVELQVRSLSPAYAALMQPQPLTAQQIQQQLLSRDTLLLEYSLGAENSYVLALTSDTIQAFKLAKRDKIETAARRVYELVTARNRFSAALNALQREDQERKLEAEYRRAATQLSNLILAPLGQELKAKRLLVVSDGALAYIPFSLLPQPPLSTGHTTPQAPLIMEHEIVNLPSASVLAVLRRQELGRSKAPNAVAVLADPVFDEADPRVKAAKGENGKKEKPMDLAAENSFSSGLLTRSISDTRLERDQAQGLPRLRFSRAEADAILAVSPKAGSMKAVDFEATRATAMATELSRYKIVHFATHGLLDSQHPELSGLVFSLVDKDGKAQEGFVQLQDIYNMNIPADLVVLSACETGLGKEITGEGLIGLTRGFMYAGASRVVASLWNVSDMATAKLMATFYTAMQRDRMTPAAALRSAQIQMLKQPRWSSPYYWAAFQIQGEWK